jgi:hypothetical protein
MVKVLFHLWDKRIENCKFNCSSCLSALNASCDFYVGWGGGAGRSPLGINHGLHLRGGRRTGVYSKKSNGLLQGISARPVAVELFLS